MPKRLPTDGDWIRRIALSPPASAPRLVGIGVVVGLIGLVLRGLFSEVLGGLPIYIAFVPGIILAALWGGRIAGFTTLLVSLGGGALWSQWIGQTPWNSYLQGVTTATLLVVGGFSVIIAAALRKALRALDDSDVELRAMVAQAAAGIVRSDLDGRIVSANARFGEMLGRPPGNLAGHLTTDFTHPDDIEATQVFVQDTPTGGDERQLAKRYVRPDGGVTSALLSVRTLRDADDRAYGFMTVAVDVSHQRRIEDALRESEERFRLMADTAPSPVWLTNEDGEVEFVNQALVVFYGHPAESILGHVWKQHIHPDDVDAVAAVQAEFRPARRPYGFECRFQRADGAWRWMRVSVNPRHDGAGVFRGYVGLSFDVTESREALDALRESERRFRDVADTAPVLIWVTGPDRLRAFVNQAYVAFMGGDYETVRTADWRTYIHPDDHDRLVAESVAGEATGEPFPLEARYLRHDGQWRWLRSFSRPRFGPDGQVVGFVGVAFDITEARRAEDDLTRINELLEERVGEALAEKAKAEADLMHAQRMEAVGRLTGGVAHDFNNLLTVVIGALDLILRSPDDAARRKKLGEAALAAARRGESLTHQLLAFSRRQALRPEPIDLNALIRQTEPLMRGAVGAAIEFRLKLRRGGARVSVDPAQFEAALLNLIVNARDALASRKGKSPGRITVQTMSCVVEPGQVVDLTPGDYVCITVSDNGAGMDAATLTRVFEPFFTTKSVGKGTGLGLSQVYGFARQSGGGVQISSTVGRGTEIRMYLPPLAQGALVAAAIAAEDPDPPSSGHRLLLVEDDLGVSAVAVELLEGLGLDVVATETGPEALDALTTGRFDVMLSDVVMPGGMTGIELARRAGDLYPDLRIILTSGYAGDDVDEALADAPWPFLRKPYSRDQLRDALAALLPLPR